MVLLPQTQGHRAHSPDQGLGASAERKTRGRCIEARLLLTTTSVSGIVAHIQL